MKHSVHKILYNNSINSIVVSDLHCSSSIYSCLSFTALFSSVTAALSASVLQILAVSVPCSVCLTSIYSSVLNILYQSRDVFGSKHSPAGGRRGGKKKKKQLTFRWPLQFPSPSLLARRQQAVVLVFLRVLLFPAGQESVLLGPAPALTLGAVLCPAGGRVSGDPVLHFPLLLFGEAGIGRPVSVPAHVSIVDLCHGRPTHPCVAVAHTHTAFERATALDLRAREEGETLTSSQSVSFRDDYCCSRSRGCFEGVWHITGIYCRWLSNKQNLPGVTTNHPAYLKKSKAGGIIRVRINPP